MSELGAIPREATSQNEHQDALQTPAEQRCYDWMLVCGNIHYAKDRASFTETTKSAAPQEAPLSPALVPSS